ncbi:MAG: hypothetical protein JO289_21000 [Xanthobacteraceae bacterium]|nr:hypothetical protein [Xanthobacteraceae bacterium]
MASEGRTPRDRRGASTIEPPAGDTPPESQQDVGAPAESAGISEEGAPVAAEAAPIEPAASDTPPPVVEPGPPEPIPPPPVREHAPRRRLFWPMLGSAVLGAILALAALGFMWRFNVLEPYKIDIGGKLLSARLAALEARVRDNSRPAPAPAAPVPLAAPAPANTKALDELAARVAKLEAAPAGARPAAPDPAVTNKLNSLEAAIKPLDEAVAANDKRDAELQTTLRDTTSRLDATSKMVSNFIDEQKQKPTVDKSEITQLDTRIAAIENATKSLAASSAAAGAADKTADRNLRVAIVALALRDAVERGSPYAPELAALKSLTGNAQALAPLEPFAATGVPTQAALARELAAAVPAMSHAAQTGPNPTEGGFLQRLEARASQFVQVRPVGDAAGDDPAAIVARIGAEAGRADIAAAVGDIGKLPPSAQAPAQPFLAKVQTRDAALAAAQHVVADALAALGKS